MKFTILDETLVHYILSISAVGLLCSLAPITLGLSAPFSSKFLLVLIPISVFVGTFNATASLAKSKGGILARIAKLALGYCLVIAAILLLGSAVAFYSTLFRVMLVWQMIAALAGSTAAVMTWRFFEGAATNRSRALLGLVAFTIAMTIAVALFRHFASIGWQINGSPRT